MFLTSKNHLQMISNMNNVHSAANVILRADITDSMDMNFGKLWETGTGRSRLLQSVGSQRVGYNLATEQQQHGAIFWQFTCHSCGVSPWQGCTCPCPGLPFYGRFSCFRGSRKQKQYVNVELTKKDS